MVQRTLVPLLLVLVSSIPVGGQSVSTESGLLTVSREFMNICGAESRYGCFSVVMNTVNSSEGTRFSLWLRNEENGFGGPTTMSNFVASALEPVPDQSAVNGIFQDRRDNFFSRGVGSVLAFGSDPGQGDPVQGSDPRFFWWTPIVTGNLLVGCSWSPWWDTDSFSRGGFSTCADDGYSGWLTYGFSSSNTFTADDLQLSLNYSTYSETGGSRGTCIVSSDALAHTCVSVPEPGTLGLLFAGLLGLFGVSLRRREREV